MGVVVVFFFVGGCCGTGFSIGAPAFPQVQVVLPPSAMDALDVGDTFLESGSDVLVTITAHGASPTAVYVVNATANGQVLATPFVNWDQLVNDGKVRQSCLRSCWYAPG